MYHELTYKKEKALIRTRIIRLLFIIAILVVAYLGVTVLQNSAREQATISVRETIVNAAKQCCAVEGSYPSSLEHLEQNYGLVVNHDDYVISYEWFADNILPTVVVTAR